ncbi:hypothetical protein KIN20_017921 [Parelaphostrongylus tenuis]|uniref:Uncharacterized protein n=1 Tax=Parelaphostrongylus tenuis TaxID=148309 RepID=A0AAD5QRR6_PARTN|nr:hypothetical protein KIN20_017921 [Parelaphostrongylus tenuis]
MALKEHFEGEDLPAYGGTVRSRHSYGSRLKTRRSSRRLHAKIDDQLVASCLELTLDSLKVIATGTDLILQVWNTEFVECKSTCGFKPSLK